MRRIKLLLLGFLIPFLSGFIYYSWAEAFEPPQGTANGIWVPG